MSTFRIGDRIGAGGMATVHLAVQEGPGGFEKYVAFKRVMGWVEESDHLANSFLKEARLAAQMSHPSIVNTLDVGRDDVSAYIVMEYLRGETVAYMLQTLKGNGADIPVPIACHIAAQVAGGLDYAHSMRIANGLPAPIVHRDVSPSNIMACYNGAVKLLDFGIATRPAEGHTQADMLKGKVSHMAPEQLQGAPPDPRSDVFQLGVVLWEMLTMRRLFPGANNVQRMHAVLRRDIVAPSTHNKAVPGALDEIVLGALERDVNKRCSTALQLQEQLESCIPELHTIGGRKLRSWMVQAFPNREEHWAGLEQEALHAPSVSAEPTPAVRSKLPWRAAAAGVTTVLTTGLVTLLLAQGMARAPAPSSPPTATVEGTALEVAYPVSEVDTVPASVAPMAEPDEADPDEPESDEAEPDEAEPDEVEPDDAPPEPDQAEPDADEPQADDPAPVRTPTPAPRSPPPPAEEPPTTLEPNPPSGWRIDDTEDILDPFAPGK